ncbi:hypothetical protein AB0I39_33980 [Kitasatospora purpeofusca]|uniref:hypothetical protein n=1 Tax=Kitasatospora purpeofusca TaxID=67352 RepID=UPI0033FB22F5
MDLRDMLIDAWSWLNYKPITAQSVRRGAGPFGESAGERVPLEDLRRLRVYEVLAAYNQNQFGQLVLTGGDEGGLDGRELGDPAKINTAALGYLLGASQRIVVPGAEGGTDSGDPPRPGQRLCRPG